MAITKGPLNGIRILDMTHMHAGPYGTMLLGDLGAEVIKLESPTGDMMRMGNKEVTIENLYIIGINRNKKSLVLNLKGEYGKKAFYDLVRKSDVVYSNTRAEVPQRQGTDFNTLKKINPGIIRCNISGYGETGPAIGYPSFDIIACGHSGILSISGEPGKAPIIPGGIALADMMGGIVGSMSVLAALVRRKMDGKGVQIETNLLDGLLLLQQVMFQYYFLSGEEPGLQGKRHLFGPGYGIYDTKDSHITMCPDDHDKALKLIGLEWTLSDPRFAKPDNRVKNREELDKYIEDALLEKTTEEWIKLLRDQNDLACGPVLNYEQIFNDPQVLHNKMIIEMELKGEKYNTLGSLFKLSKGNNQDLIEGTFESAPDLGANTDEILKDILCYSDDMIEKIKAENVAYLQTRSEGAQIIRMPSEEEISEQSKE
ncbi:MAG: CoA transferase [Spirochaetota bacterium]|nr:CoA transferase [Spirochaetota bacterium]